MILMFNRWFDRLRAARDYLWREGVHYAPSIEGRGTLIELFVTLAATMIVYTVLSPLTSRLNGDLGELLQAALVLLLMLPVGSAVVRRMHDTGRSGWDLWIVFIPWWGWLRCVLYLLWDGTDGPNIFGPDPRQRG
jgi:uncharacterized membrane protein YhaH (DUF805 family)